MRALGWFGRISPAPYKPPCPSPKTSESQTPEVFPRVTPNPSCQQCSWRCQVLGHVWKWCSHTGASTSGHGLQGHASSHQTWQGVTLTGWFLFHMLFTYLNCSLLTHVETLVDDHLMQFNHVFDGDHGSHDCACFSLSTSSHPAISRKKDRAGTHVPWVATSL